MGKKDTTEDLGDQPPEYSESYLASDAGLSEDVLKALPPDPPPGHIAFRRCRLRADHYGGGVIPFAITQGGSTTRGQAAVKSCGGSVYAAFRIARALYVHAADDGCTKDELDQYRNQYYDQLKGALMGRKLPVAKEAKLKQELPVAKEAKLKQERTRRPRK